VDDAGPAQDGDDRCGEKEGAMRLARSGAVIAATCAIALALAGCGTPCPEAAACKTYSPGQTRQPSGDDIVCLKEPQTGSHIVETRCYKHSEIEERRKADRDMLERAQMNSNRPVRR
jgi:hypothetical protein